jgi:hypothetical protein
LLAIGLIVIENKLDQQKQGSAALNNPGSETRRPRASRNDAALGG